MKKRKLTPKQQAFADHYIELGNAYQAAIKAGYSKNYAKGNVVKLLENVSVKSYIDQQMKEIASKRIMGATEALELLTSIARGEIIEEVVVSTFEGTEKVEKIPDVRDRQRAEEELLKRYNVSESDRLKDKLLEARIDKLKAETKNEETGESRVVIVNDKEAMRKAMQDGSGS